MEHTISRPSFVGKLDNGSGSAYRFKISDEQINRNGWKIITSGINTDKYMRNPVVLFGHDDGKFPVGKTLKVFSQGSDLFADILFHDKTEEARVVSALIDEGFLNMTSIGINVLKRGAPIPIPADQKTNPWIDTYEVFEQSELLEISVVDIPANGDAGFVEKLKAARAAAPTLSVDWDQIVASCAANKPANRIPGKFHYNNDRAVIAELYSTIANINGTSFAEELQKACEKGDIYMS